MMKVVEGLQTQLKDLQRANETLKQESGDVVDEIGNLKEQIATLTVEKSELETENNGLKGKVETKELIVKHTIERFEDYKMRVRGVANEC